MTGAEVSWHRSSSIQLTEPRTKGTAGDLRSATSDIT